MATKKIDIEKELNKPLPKEVIKQREGGRGMMLDYLEGWWVKQNANRIFGINKWSFKPVWEQMKHIPLPKTLKGKTTGLYTVPIILTVNIDGVETERSDIGSTQYYGDEGKEMAIKGCVTDALKRCFSSFGEQFGLSLYDKKGMGSSATKGQTGKKTYLSQEELMKKFGMNPKQVAPKCPACDVTMKLIARKDGSGIFWSCPNWRTKGCKGMNVEDVDLDGNPLNKTVAKQEPLEEKEQEKVDVEDIPF